MPSINASPTEQSPPVKLLAARSLLIFAVAATVATLAGVGAGAAAWSMQRATLNSDSIALFCAFFAGGAMWYLTLLSVAKSLDKLTQ